MDEGGRESGGGGREYGKGRVKRQGCGRAKGQHTNDGLHITCLCTAATASRFALSVTFKSRRAIVLKERSGGKRRRIHIVRR